MLKRTTLILVLLLLVGSLLFQSSAQSQDPTATPAPTLIPGLPTEQYIIEAEDPIVIKEGEWDEFESTSASGNAYVASKRTGDQQLGLLFEGTRIEVIYARHEAFGTMLIEVDNEIVQTIDTKSDTAQFNVRAVVNELEPGYHIIRVRAERGAIAIDGFEVTPTEQDLLMSLLPERIIVDQAELLSAFESHTHIMVSVGFEVPTIRPYRELTNEEVLIQYGNVAFVADSIAAELTDFDADMARRTPMVVP